MSSSPMALALAEAEAAGGCGEVPVGAVLVDAAGDVLAAAGNRVERDHDPTAHAEMLVLRAAAARLRTAQLAECDLWVTLEPCAMCAAAIAFARLRRLYFGAWDPKRRRGRARPTPVRAADDSSPPRGLWRHRRTPRRSAAARIFPRPALVPPVQTRYAPATAKPRTARTANINAGRSACLRPPNPIA